MFNEHSYQLGMMLWAKDTMMNRTNTDLVLKSPTVQPNFFICLVKVLAVNTQYRDEMRWRWRAWQREREREMIPLFSYLIFTIPLTY